MKNSGRDVLTGMLDFQYRMKKVLLKNSITLENSTANESNYGSFSEYTKLNPYLTPYDENGNMKGDHLIGKYYVAFDQHFRAEVQELAARFTTLRRPSPSS